VLRAMPPSRSPVEDEDRRGDRVRAAWLAGLLAAATVLGAGAPVMAAQTPAPVQVQDKTAVSGPVGRVTPECLQARDLAGVANLQYSTEDNSPGGTVRSNRHFSGGVVSVNVAAYTQEKINTVIDDIEEKKCSY